jgi:hypothetical protein
VCSTLPLLVFELPELFSFHLAGLSWDFGDFETESVEKSASDFFLLLDQV